GTTHPILARCTHSAGPATGRLMSESPGIERSSGELPPLSAFEVRSRRVVVEQIVRRNPLLGSVAGHQLPGNAVHPGIRLQPNLPLPVIHLASPGPSDTGNVEVLDRLLLPVVAHLAENPQFAAPAAGLGPELLVELLAQMRGPFQPQHKRLIVHSLHG